MSQSNVVNEAMIRDIVLEVLSQLLSASVSSASAQTFSTRFGVYQDPNQAVRAARDAFEQLKTKGLGRSCQGG